jgi:hypothetical protein
MPASTPRLALPYPIPDDTVDVPRDVQALATKLETLQDLGVPYPGQGCQVGGVTAAGNSSAFPQLIGATGTTNPPTRNIPAGSVSGAVFTVPVAGIWRLTLHLRFDNQAGGKQAYGQRVMNGANVSSWNLVWVYSAAAGSYAQGQGSEELACNVGDTLTCRIGHDDATSRTLTWRMMIDRIT